MSAPKTVIITGSSQGIGEATAILFAKKGFNVVLHGRNKEKKKSDRKKESQFGFLILRVGCDGVDDRS